MNDWIRKPMSPMRRIPAAATIAIFWNSSRVGVRASLMTRQYLWKSSYSILKAISFLTS